MYVMCIHLAQNELQSPSVPKILCQNSPPPPPRPKMAHTGKWNKQTEKISLESSSPQKIACPLPWVVADCRTSGSPPCTEHVELLEALHAQETFQPKLQHSHVGEVGAGAGILEGFVPLNLPCSSIGDFCLKGHSQLHQVDGPVVPESYVWCWSMMAMLLGKLYWLRRSAVICIPDGRLCLQKLKMTASISACLAV